MAEGKWISDLAPDTPLADAARRVLAVRLEVVRDYLPLALHKADKDTEYVHQLRVGTRRAGAALDTFADCLSPKAYRRARRRLRRIRRAAGEARNWDVFLADLAEREQHHPEKDRHGLDLLLGYAHGQRLAAQVRLQEAGPAEPLDFDRFLAKTVAAVGEPSSALKGATLLDLARVRLGELLRGLHQAGEQDLENYDHLHRVRILGKRLRYAMEIFADCFEAPFREELYPAVEEMQEILGRANDSHVAGQRLRALRDHLAKVQPAEWKRFKPGIEGLLRYHQRRLPQQRRQFLKWWERWQKTEPDSVLGSLTKGSSVAVS
jgi:CHAD domain-containing protein